MLWAAAKTRPQLTRQSPHWTLTTTPSRAPSTDTETPLTSRVQTHSKQSPTTLSQPTCRMRSAPCPRTETSLPGPKLKTFLVGEEELLRRQRPLSTLSTTRCRSQSSTLSPVGLRPSPAVLTPSGAHQPDHLKSPSNCQTIRKTPLRHFHSQSQGQQMSHQTPLLLSGLRQSPSCRSSLPTWTTRLTPFP